MKRINCILSFILVLSILLSVNSIAVSPAVTESQLLNDQEIIYMSDSVNQYDSTTAANVAASSIRINIGQSYTGYANTQVYLKVLYYPDDATQEKVTWTTDNANIVTVNSDGNATLRAAGTATVTAKTASGLTATCRIQVEEVPAIVCDQAVTLSTQTGSGVGLFRFVPEVDGTYCFYSFDNQLDVRGQILDSDMFELLADDDSGDGNNFRAQYDLKAGKVYYFKSMPYTTSSVGSYSVKVVRLVKATAMTMNVGTTYKGFVGSELSLTVNFAPANAATELVTWSSTDTDVATVDKHGWLRLVGEGTATIKAVSQNGLVATCAVTVEDYPTITLGQKQTVTLDANNPYAYFYFTPAQDGYYAFYSISDADTYGAVLDMGLNQLAWNDDSGDGDNFRVGYQMEAGTTYILRAKYYNMNTVGSFTVCVEKTGYITGLKVVQKPTKIQYVQGFACDSLDYHGLQLQATWSDGSTTTWTAHVDDYFIGDQYVDIDASSVDEDGKVRIYCGDLETSFSVQFIANPVQKLEIVHGTSQEFIENYNGYFEGTDFYYYTEYPTDVTVKVTFKDGTTALGNVGGSIDGYVIDWYHNQYEVPWKVGSNNVSYVTYLGHTVNLPITIAANTVSKIQVVSGKVTCIQNTYGYEDFYYNEATGDFTNFYHYNFTVPADLQIKITYKNGTTKTVGYYDVVDGYKFETIDEQSMNPWVLGNSNLLPISYVGVTTNIPVSVIASPVSKIVVNTAPTKVYVYGDAQFGYLNEEGDYEFNPTDLTGLRFTVSYTDGTSKVLTYNDIDANGNIDGFGYELLYDGYNPAIGQFPVTFSYMGKTVTYSVALQNTTATALAVTKMPAIDQLPKEYAPDFVGTEFTVTFADGSTKVLALTEDNIKYVQSPWTDEPSYEAMFDGYKLIIEPYTDEEGVHYVAYYMGVQCNMQDIVVIKGKEINTIELYNVKWNGNALLIKVNYTDGSTDTLKMDAVSYQSWDDGTVSGFGRTQNGLVRYSIRTHTDANGNPVKYDVSILGLNITVNAGAVILGDLNYDGFVDEVDVLALTRYLAYWDGYTTDTINLAAADVNGDGAVNGLDRLILSRHVAGWEGYETLSAA